MKVVWDETKNELNRRKHGVSFEEASAVLRRVAERLDMYDDEHSHAEDRFLAVGSSGRAILAVVYSEPEDDLYRIISARRVTKEEMRQYLAFLRVCR